MSPFKEKKVKWDGDDDNGRFKNEGGFKYDIINKTVVKKAEDMPKCYLADTPKEAEDLYKQFEKLINNLSLSYSISTGLAKTDLFGEGLIGLGRAYRDWDPSRSDNFRAYATFIIKDALNEFVRDNMSTISVPTYIRKAQANLKGIKAICEATGIDPNIVIRDQELPDELEPHDAIRAFNRVKALINCAERARISYDELIERIETVPEETDNTDYVSNLEHKREIEKIEATIVVEKLQERMNKVELFICKGIMEDKSYEQIGKELGKSKAWVSGRLKKFRERILKMMEEGKL